MVRAVQTNYCLKCFSPESSPVLSAQMIFSTGKQPNDIDTQVWGQRELTAKLTGICVILSRISQNVLFVKSLHSEPWDKGRFLVCVHISRISFSPSHLWTKDKRHPLKEWKANFWNLDSSCFSSISFIFQISWTEKLTSHILLFQDKKLSCQSPSRKSD